jgi:translation initiation factor 2B subunit (eIF-2B alpha/beta/delta family)
MDKGQIKELVKPISDDILSGAAEIALRAITIFQTVLTSDETHDVNAAKGDITELARALVKAQPAMGPLFHLCNQVLFAAENSKTLPELQNDCQKALDDFEKELCDRIAPIADLVFDLIPPGELVFAYSFSSTVVSCLLNARARGKYFRVACSESRPSNEGRKLAARLAAGNIEVIYTFDSAMGLVLPNCSVAFMGCDCVGMPGLVNKVGSLLLGLACKDMNIPLYALTTTDKFVSEERLFEFENHERPGSEVWEEAPKGVRVLNRQFELIPLKYLAGLVTEKGIIRESQLEKHLLQKPVHKALELVTATF